MALIFRTAKVEENPVQVEKYAWQHLHKCSSQLCGRWWRCGDEPPKCDLACPRCGSPAVENVMDALAGVWEA